MGLDCCFGDEEMEERSFDGVFVFVLVLVVEVEVIAGAFEGVLVADAEGVEEVGGGLTFSRSSPYSFHSSISLRSCICHSHELLVDYVDRCGWAR